MAEEILGKKISDLPEKTEPVDTDVYVFGDAGTNVLKKAKWSNMLSKIVSKLAANNLTTTIAGYFLDARQGKALKDSIDELNTNTKYETTLTTVDTAKLSCNVAIVKVGHMVYGSISISTKTSGSLSAWEMHEIVSAANGILAQYRPAKEERVFMSQQNGAGEVRIRANGSIAYRPWITMNAQFAAGGQFAYLSN